MEVAPVRLTGVLEFPKILENIRLKAVRHIRAHALAIST